MSKGKPIPQRKPGDPHPPHTTVYNKDRGEAIPPEAQAVIDAQMPQIRQAFLEYGQHEGMLAMYVATRDATKAAGWPNDRAYIIRDHILTALNAAKQSMNYGSDGVFQIESATEIVDRLLG